MLLDRSPSDLGLPPRDANFFERSAFCVPPAALLWRKDALFVRLVRATAKECSMTTASGRSSSPVQAVTRRAARVKDASLPCHPQDPFMAIVRPSEVLIFEPRRGVVACAANHAVAQANSASFALSVLDVLLSRAVNHSRHKLTRLCSAVDCALDDISLALRHGGASGESFTRLVPLTRALAALASDVTEVQEALHTFGKDEQALRAMGAGAVSAAAEPEATWETFAAVHEDYRGRHELSEEDEEEQELRKRREVEEEAAAETKGVITTYLRQARVFPLTLHSASLHATDTRPLASTPPTPLQPPSTPTCPNLARLDSHRSRPSEVSCASSVSTSPPHAKCGSSSSTAPETACTGWSCR